MSEKEITRERIVGTHTRSSEVELRSATVVIVDSKKRICLLFRVHLSTFFITVFFSITIFDKNIITSDLFKTKALNSMEREKEAHRRCLLLKVARTWSWRKSISMFFNDCPIAQET